MGLALREGVGEGTPLCKLFIYLNNNLNNNNNNNNNDDDDDDDDNTKASYVKTGQL